MLTKLLIDFLLLIGYPLQHSLLASVKSKLFFKKMIPPHVYRLIYSLCAALYIIVAGFFWQDVPIVIYEVTGLWQYVIIAVGLLGWFGYAFSHLAYYDVGGVFGVSQWVHHKLKIEPPRFDFSTNGLKAYVRFPVHTAFIPMFWGITTMTASTLLFSIVASLYAWLGTFHHDYRYTKAFGKPYREYKKHTGMVFPIFRRCKSEVVDSTPRKETTSTIIITSLLLIPFWFLFAMNAPLTRETQLLIIPLTTMIIMYFTGLFVTLLTRAYWYGTDDDRVISEKYSFAMGVISGIFTYGIYTATYFMQGELMTLIPALSSWVLGLIAGSFGCYTIARIPKIYKPMKLSDNQEAHI